MKKIINDEGEIEINLHSLIIVGITVVGIFFLTISISNSENSSSKLFSIIGELLGYSLIGYLVYLLIKYIKKKRK